MSVILHKQCDVSGEFEDVDEGLAQYAWVHPFVFEVLRHFREVRGKYLGVLWGSHYRFGHVYIHNGQIKPDKLTLFLNTDLQGDEEIETYSLHAALFAKLAMKNANVTNYTVSYEDSNYLRLTAIFPAKP